MKNFQINKYFYEIKEQGQEFTLTIFSKVKDPSNVRGYKKSISSVKDYKKLSGALNRIAKHSNTPKDELDQFAI